jgi:hypothetical protein
LAEQDTVNVDTNQYAFVRYNNPTDGKSMLIALTNQIKQDITIKGADVSKAFTAGDKICDTVTTTPADCLTVGPKGLVDITIKAGGLPKVYMKSQ